MAFVAWQFGLPLIRDLGANVGSSGSADGAQNPATATQPGRPACPQAAAAYLPGKAGTLVGQYQSDKHLITVCQASSGQLYYDGQTKGQPSDTQNHISLPAESTSEGYVAHNGVYTYEIRGLRIIVTKSGAVILDSMLTSVS